MRLARLNFAVGAVDLLNTSALFHFKHYLNLWAWGGGGSTGTPRVWRWQHTYTMCVRAHHSASPEVRGPLY